MGATKIIVKQDELSIIKFDGIKVRIITYLGEPWFIANDVCLALEHSNPTKAIKSLNSLELMTLTLSYSHSGKRGGARKLLAVSESGFYKLIARSRKAIQQGTFAYRFSNWVFGEVIPAIRKTGAYGVPWAFLNDHAKREKEYLIESSKRGRNLEACKKWKANLIAEEQALWKKYQPELI